MSTQCVLARIRDTPYIQRSASTANRLFGSTSANTKKMGVRIAVVIASMASGLSDQPAPATIHVAASVAMNMPTLHAIRTAQIVPRRSPSSARSRAADLWPASTLRCRRMRLTRYRPVSMPLKSAARNTPPATSRSMPPSARMSSMASIG